MPKHKSFFQLLMLLIITVSITGCLTCERKEYVFKLTGYNSGILTIKYVNIFSGMIDSTGEIDTDYDELITMWLYGKKLESDFPGATNFRKRIFEENGKLCGEVSMEFDDLQKVRLYQYNNKGPIMFSLTAVNDDGENFDKSNGEYGGEKMPVIFWPEDTRTLQFITKIAEPDSTCVSMLDVLKEKRY